jgi:hypothetical protein
MRSAATQIGFDVAEELIIFEQPIKFGQLRFEAQLKRGHHREQVDGRGPIS